MTTLTLRRDYLDHHRRFALGRALVGSLSGLIPVPFIDDWLREAVMGRAYKRIAGDHQIDLDEAAVKNLVHGRSKPASWVDLTSGAVMVRIAGRTWQRFLLAVTALRRAQAATHNFAALTLFDHYCARVHTGLGLDGPRALAVADTISATLATTPGGLSFEPFRKGALAAARGVVKAPLELADLASGGRVRKLLARGGDKGGVTEAEAVDDVDRLVDKELADDQGWLSRTVAAIELQLTADGNPFLETAIDRFDAAWRGRT